MVSRWGRSNASLLHRLAEINTSMEKAFRRSLSAGHPSSARHAEREAVEHRHRRRRAHCCSCFPSGCRSSHQQLWLQPPLVNPCSPSRSSLSPFVRQSGGALPESSEARPSAHFDTVACDDPPHVAAARAVSGIGFAGELARPPLAAPCRYPPGRAHVSLGRWDWSPARATTFARRRVQSCQNKALPPKAIGSAALVRVTLGPLAAFAWHSPA